MLRPRSGPMSLFRKLLIFEIASDDRSVGTCYDPSVMKRSQAHRRLSLPTGTETLHLREVARQKRISRVLEDLFGAWGYSPVETPLVDYYEVYRRLLDGQDIRQIYRAVDRQGEILALRSDTTMFLAKQLALHLSAEELPVRVYYDEQIVRAEEQHDISRNEYQQAGVELVGVEGIEGDAEILVLARESLAALGLENAVIHIGSHRVVEAVVGALPSDEREAARQAIARRRFDDAGLSGITREVEKLLRFIGTVEDFDTLVSGIRRTVTTEIGDSIDDLKNAVRRVQSVCPDVREEEFRIDLSELGTHGYYTGIAFGAYLSTGNTAVLRGGRYDHLLDSFGFAAPSVGFSMFTRKLPYNVLGAETHDRGTGRFALAARVAAGRKAFAEGER